MSKKIKNLDITRLRTEEDFGFMPKVVNLTELLAVDAAKATLSSRSTRAAKKVSATAE